MQSEHPGIQSARVLALRIPTDFPESDGTADWDATTVVIVRMTCAGHTALGYSYADAAAAHVAEALLREIVIGKSPLMIPTLHLALERKVRNMGRPGLASCAIAAIDTALWDLKGRLLKLPLTLLIGQSRPHVEAYGSGGFTSYSQDQLIRQLSGWASQGFKSVKMKIGTGDDTLQRVKAVRKALPASCELYVDANGAYSRKQALDLGQKFAQLGATWFEEPVTSDDAIGLHLLVDRLSPPIRVAAGEYIYTPDDAMKLLRGQSVDVLQTDATRCGGVSDFVAIAHAAQMHHIPFSAHTAPSLHASLCCSVEAAINIEYFHDHARIEQMIFDGAIRPRSGTLAPDLTRPGVGLELKSTDAEQYLVFDSGDITAKQ
jgi:L-alanine-DL-glutamate epimerase-like enolase superfamily enzyme